MFIERFDIEKGKLTVGCGSENISEVPVYLASLIIVAEECDVKNIVLRHPGGIPPHTKKIIDTFVERNPWISLEEQSAEKNKETIPVFTAISQNKDFLFLRDSDTDWLYSIIIPARQESVELATKTAYLVANIMGFPGSTAFDVRFGVYEILMNVIDHNYCPEDDKWIQVLIERKLHKLSVSIIDPNKEFNPTSPREFDLDEYISSGKRRGLGLLLMKRMYESFHYERKNGLNKVVFDSIMPSYSGGEGEDEMPSMELGDFVNLENGITKIELKGDLDAKGALVLESLMGQLLENKVLKVALDFEKVPFVSSAGIGMLLGMTSTLRDEGGEVWLTSTSQQVLSVFALLNLDDYFLLMDPDEAIIQG